MGTALVLGSSSVAQLHACEALKRSGWDVIDDFERLSAGAAPHLVVFVTDLSGDAPLLQLSPARFRELERASLVEPWETLREAVQRLSSSGGAVIIVAAVAGAGAGAGAGATQSGTDATRSGAFAAAAQRALRIMVSAAVVELGAREAPAPAIRVNLLEYDAHRFDAHAFERALAFLASPRSSFMTGTHLRLPGTDGVAEPGSAS